MRATVFPGTAEGAVQAVTSKSHALRLLILSSLCQTPTLITGISDCDDIEAAINCLRALGGVIEKDGGSVIVTPGAPVNKAKLDCGESASLYRFLLPITAALGVSAEFVLGAGLKRRPIAPLAEQLSSHGAIISDFTRVSGKLTAGEYRLPGDISSQFVSGLCMALALLPGDSVIVIEGELQSRGYVELTLETLAQFGIVEETRGNSIYISGGGRFKSPGAVKAQGDWSNSAMLLCCGALGGDVRVGGLEADSSQPDKAVTDILKKMGVKISFDASGVRARGGKMTGRVIDVSGTPDIAPALAVAALGAEGETVLTGAKRLRLKESDRVKAIVQSLTLIGANVIESGDDIIIKGNGRVKGGEADCANDHRIAMMLSCAAAMSENPITIDGAQAVRKSYTAFFDDMRKIGLRILEDDR